MDIADALAGLDVPTYVLVGGISAVNVSLTEDVARKQWLRFTRAYGKPIVSTTLANDMVYTWWTDAGYQVCMTRTVPAWWTDDSWIGQ